MEKIANRRFSSMQTKPLPRTNLQVSVIGLGTDYFGSTIDRKLSMQILDRYVESGGNFIDTAEVYARLDTRRRASK